MINLVFDVCLSMNDPRATVIGSHNKRCLDPSNGVISLENTTLICGGERWRANYHGRARKLIILLPRLQQVQAGLLYRNLIKLIRKMNACCEIKFMFSEACSEFTAKLCKVTIKFRNVCSPFNPDRMRFVCNHFGCRALMNTAIWSISYGGSVNSVFLMIFLLWWCANRLKQVNKNISNSVLLSFSS